MGVGCGCYAALVAFFLSGLSFGQYDILNVNFSVLPHRYDCGEYSMRLLVFPRQGFTVRFKVVDEFGTAFEVTHCSVCLHWITVNDDGAAVFSAGYGGCHVLKKDGRNNLKVRVEEIWSNGRVGTSHDITMICPKPQGPAPQPGAGRPAPQPGAGRPAPQPGAGRPAPQPGAGRPAPQPGAGRPAPQPGAGRPAPQPGAGRPAPQPGAGRPAPQPGAGRPAPQPGAGRPAPQPGAGRPAPQPGAGRPAPQPGAGRPAPPSNPLHFIASGTLTPEQCQVVGRRISCADVQDAAACHQAGCCYDDSDLDIPCYYGNTVTVQCLQDGHFILAVSRDMLDYPIVLDSVRLSYAQSGCDPVEKTEAFLIFRFPLTHCGTRVQVMGDKLIYENQLASGISIQSGPDGSITRDSTFTLHARCIYNATDFLPVQVEVVLPPTPAPVFQVGPLRLELRIATDSSYSSYYSDTDYPVVKMLRDPVHVEVRILQRMDPSLVLVLHECWATPSANPLEQLQWPILVNGCPFDGDNYRTRLVSMGPATSELPFPTHYQRFIISTFAFVDVAPQTVLDGLVYLFCTASACHPSQLEPCRKTCRPGASPRSRRFLNDKNTTESLDLVSSLGPLLFAEETRQEASHRLENEVDMNVVILGLFSLIFVVSSIVAFTMFWRRNQKSFCGKAVQ